MPLRSLSQQNRLRPYLKKYESELLDRVIPFWEAHSIDRQHGGYFNCLNRDGTLFDTKKYVWLQGRQAWMFSKLYQTIDPRPEWLEIARLGIEFLRQHAIREDGQVYFCLSAEGKPVAMQRKIFSACFMVMALAEFSRASGESQYLEEAQTLMARIMRWIEDPAPLGRPVLSGQTPMQTLAVPMITLNLIEELTGEDETLLATYTDQVTACITQMLEHVHPADRCVYENVAPGGAKIDSPEGRLLNPGHAIEAGWFLAHWAERLNRSDLAENARDMVRWSYAQGWDDTYGGIFYFLDAGGHSPTQLEWSMKLWWPHCEALYAHLLNFVHTGEAADLEAFQAVDDYIFTHFQDPDHGEWYGYLNRRGEATHSFKGGPYKGCFHVPRALWLCIELLRRAGV